MPRSPLRAARLALVLAACGDGDADTTIDRVFDPCERIALAPDPGTTAEELAAIDQAIAMWRAVEVGEVARGGTDGAALPIRFEDAAAAFRGIYLDEVGIIVVNRGLDGAPGQAVAIAHELGHAFGLEHVDADARPSVMNHGNLDVWPTGGDAAAIGALWGRCSTTATRPPLAPARR